MNDFIDKLQELGKEISEKEWEEFDRIVNRKDQMKWVESFREQGLICEKTGNRFTIDIPEFFGKLNFNQIIVCVPFKTFCHSKACFEKRYPEGKNEQTTPKRTGD